MPSICRGLTVAALLSLRRWIVPLGGEYVHLVTSPKLEEAQWFENIDAAVACYRGMTGRLREDGNPDRPLTAYTVEFETWEVVAELAAPE
jgi:hypothetical protein